jgi:hypothetical protein
VDAHGDPGGVRQGGGGADTGFVSATTTTQPVVVWASWAPPKIYETPLSSAVRVRRRPRPAAPAPRPAVGPATRHAADHPAAPGRPPRPPLRRSTRQSSSGRSRPGPRPGDTGSPGPVTHPREPGQVEHRAPSDCPVSSRRIRSFTGDESGMPVTTYTPSPGPRSRHWGGRGRHRAPEVVTGAVGSRG